MAHSNERIEFLRESRQFYKHEVPPFTQRGNAGYKKEVMILPPYTEKPRKTTVVYLRYKLEGGDRTFACLRMNRQRYIVKAMKRNWQPGDPVDNTGGSCYWYRWQGPTASQQFVGPIAVSMARYVANTPRAKNGIRDAPSDKEGSRGQRSQKSHFDPTKLGSSRDGGVMEQDSTSPDLPQPRTPTDQRPPDFDLPRFTTGASKVRAKTGPTRERASANIPRKRRSSSERATRVLSPAQEHSTILHIERPEIGSIPVKIKLSSAAGITDDSEKRVNHASFFDLVTKIVNPNGQPDLIQATMCPPLSQSNKTEGSDDQAHIQYKISISYQAKETFDEFLETVKAYFEEHDLKGGDAKPFECHVAIKSTVIVP